MYVLRTKPNKLPAIKIKNYRTVLAPLLSLLIFKLKNDINVYLKQSSNLLRDGMIRAVRLVSACHISACQPYFKDASSHYQSIVLTPPGAKGHRSLSRILGTLPSSAIDYFS